MDGHLTHCHNQIGQKMEISLFTKLCKLLYGRTPNTKKSTCFPNYVISKHVMWKSSLLINYKSVILPQCMLWAWVCAFFCAKACELACLHFWPELLSPVIPLLPTDSWKQSQRWGTYICGMSNCTCSCCVTWRFLQNPVGIWLSVIESVGCLLEKRSLKLYFQISGNSLHLLSVVQSGHMRGQFVDGLQIDPILAVPRLKLWW